MQRNGSLVAITTVRWGVVPFLSLDVATLQDTVGKIVDAVAPVVDESEACAVVWLSPSRTRLL